jgi:sugar lactone lactonase YvrE
MFCRHQVFSLTMKHTTLLHTWLALLCGTVASARAQEVAYAFTNYAGLPGTAGTNDGPLVNARFHNPAGLAVSPDGSLFVADFLNHTVRRISAAGVVTTFAGSPGHSGNVDGPAAIARFNQPFFLAFDKATNLYVSDLLNHSIRRITPAGQVSTFVGGDGQFNRPAGMAFDAGGNLYVADTANHVIRVVTPGKVVVTLAGKVSDGGSSDGVAATAQFYFPSALAVDAEANIYVSDSGNDTVRRITPVGIVSTLAGAALRKASADGNGPSARFYQPYGLSLDPKGNMIVADPGNHTIRRISPAGDVTTVGGLPGQEGSADGIGKSARFSNPSSLVFGAAGTLFISDPFNHRVTRGTPVDQSAK